MNSIAFKTITIKSTFSNLVVLCVAVALLATFFCETSIAQSSTKQGQAKIEKFLEQQDANGNGKIETDEMSENTKIFLKRLSFDPEKSATISKVIKKVVKMADEKRKDEKEKVEKAASNPGTATALKVPGFGVTRETDIVKSFNASADSAAKANAKTYPTQVTEQTRRTLERYDRNKDGMLDESELSRARWGNPRPSKSDLNGDGRLSKNELNERYAARLKAVNESSDSQNKDSRKDDQADDEDSDRSPRFSRRASRSDRSGRSDSRQSSGTPPSYSNTGKPKTKKDDYAKYKKYAQSLISNYDLDEDGKLNKAEVSEMRRPPKGADVNEDGFVSEGELVDALIGANSSKKQSRSSKKQSRDSDKGENEASDSESSRTSYRKRASSSRSRRSGSLGDLDANGDNQIQMHEFSDEWDDDVVAEYYQADKNRDGVITADEWSNR